tara:strand:+ start:22995 stop:23339 length:345 start_codon:yes stop_codon:yes gene_type:complete
MIKSINFYKDNFEAIIYNISSIFFIITNLFIPLYTDDIIYFNSNIIEKITLNYKIDNNKKELFLNFTDNLIEKNKDIITKIENERIKNENIDNYTLDTDNIDNEYSDDDSWEND